MISTINTAVKSNDSSMPLRDQNPSTTGTGSNNSSQQTSTSATPPVELSTSTERAYAVINYEVSYQLNMVFGAQGVPSTTEAAAADNLPQDTTVNIVNAVATAANSVDEEHREDLLEHAREGVDRGMTAAKDVMQSQGVLSTQVDAEMATVQEKINGGISALSTPDTDGTVVSESAFLATNSRVVDNGNIQIQTNDGDMISISFNQTQEASAMAFTSTNADGSVSGMMSSQSSSASYSFSIEGELDEDEREALGKLVHDLSELSEKFFSGELEDAFEKMGSLRFDTEEFSGMSVDLNRTASMTAIGAYQTVKTMDMPAANDPVAMENMPEVPVPVPVTATPADTAVAVTPQPTEVVTTTSAEPATPTAVADAPASTPPAAPVTTEPTATPTPATTPATTGNTTTLESLISDVRQFLDNLNNLELFAQPETIAVNLFEGLTNASGNNEQISSVALDQFKQVLELASEEDEEEDDDVEVEDPEHHDHDSDDGMETEEGDSQAQQMI